MAVTGGPTPRRSGLATRAVEFDIDAPTRAAVAPIRSTDPGWLHLPQRGGSQEIGRGPRQREAVGASGRRPSRRVVGPLARPIPMLEPWAPSESTLASGPAAQPPPR